MDVEDATKLSYDNFCTRYMACNRPVLLRNVTPTWFPGTRKWHNEHSINYTHFKEHYGTALAPVASGEVAEYGAKDRQTMKVVDYVNQIENGTVGKKYLKDWHFVHAFGSDIYDTPPFFKDDWLNWWWDHKENSKSDYRFVYIGPAGSWTPLHQDVFRSYSWSVNICGRKEWIFYHPDDEPKLKDCFGYVVPDVTAEYINEERYPRIHEAKQVYTIQESGDAIFVPSGWYHQVKNLEDTISINHNWFNGYNIREVWTFLKLEYAAVDNELKELKNIGLVGYEFVDQCQRVMQANTGINYLEFRELLYAKASDLLKKRIVANDNHLAVKKSDLILHLKHVRDILQELNAALKAFDQDINVSETWRDVDLQLTSLGE
ncbi:Uncharacterized conserved protein, contains JmjC domain [Plasmopara halstedii]|uniref:Uncharacterized conserved protein, contains JmjC domain n=1 Tax=Plasmopara halstedii TaxID=4781 RepID=A0A0P1AEW9_PLAHL|nr:Uncharacterized conserved protein, contains JmjC domain [Plasmopara halstedii]CEG39140.1 Uncharacterized conserved protein, contains JmjC domain [Plasmopara halstedii]|eukprot:XP_024575509.1 Uncharacterized conserved protein, contains JmjC domain [Plasmopara halstedii]